MRYHSIVMVNFTVDCVSLSQIFFLLFTIYAIASQYSAKFFQCCFEWQFNPNFFFSPTPASN